LRFLTFRKHKVCLWLIAVVMASAISILAIASVLSTSFTATLEVKEPLSIVNYPSQFSLFPGETANFSITVTDSAPVNYSVVVDYTLNDSEYQTNYVTFSNDVYNVTPGQQDLKAWMIVASDAPPAIVTVTATLERLGTGEKGTQTTYLSDDFENFPIGWTVTNDVNGRNGIATRSDAQHYGGPYSAEINVPTVADSAWISKSFSSTPTGNFHYSIWVYVDSSVIPDEYGLFVGQLWSSELGQPNLWMSIGHVNGAFYLWNWRTNFGSHALPILENVSTLTAGVWHHIEAYYISSSGKVHYYVDSVKQGGDWIPAGTIEPNMVYLGDTHGAYYLSGLMYFDDLVVS